MVQFVDRTTSHILKRQFPREERNMSVILFERTGGQMSGNYVLRVAQPTLILFRLRRLEWYRSAVAVGVKFESILLLSSTLSFFNSIFRAHPSGIKSDDGECQSDF
jgi:hypothetical protein